MCSCDKENGYLCFDCECDIMQFEYNFLLTDDCEWIPNEPYTDQEIEEIGDKHGIIFPILKYRPKEWLKEALENIIKRRKK